MISFYQNYFVYAIQNQIKMNRILNTPFFKLMYALMIYAKLKQGNGCPSLLKQRKIFQKIKILSFQLQSL